MLAVNARLQWFQLHYPDLANDPPAYDREIIARLYNIDQALLGARLKAEREAKGIELVAMSIRIGCPESYLKCVEAGTIRPTIKMLESLAEWLDQSVKYLLCDHDQQDQQAEVKQ